MDTQGTFDSRSSTKDCATVFALSTILSSVQCYNLMHGIQEDDLQHLHMFTEYGRLALEESNHKPFQNLFFIIRDWPHHLEISYGWHGKEISDEALSENSEQTEDMRELRQSIKSNFQNISAFLMPHPGKMVAEGRFQGNMEDIEADFKEYLQILVPSLLAPEKLVVKNINGEDVRARDLVQYLEEYIKIFTGATLPEPKSVFMATAEVSNILLNKAALQLYSDFMEESFKNVGSYVSLDDLKFTHVEAKEKAFDQFDEKLKIGGAQLISSFRNDLEDEINKKYKYYKDRSKEDRKTFHLKAQIHTLQRLNESKKNYKSHCLEGATLGAIVGSPFGPLGTLIGTGIGGFIGYLN